jgi:phosphopantetheinyl transferase
VDIEKIKPYPEAVAKRCFTAMERGWLCEAAPGGARDEAFYRLWTAKESVMKATGLGFSLPPGDFSVLPMVESDSESESESSHRIAGKDWFLDWIALRGYMICIAVETRAGKTEYIELSAGDLLNGHANVTD